MSQTSDPTHPTAHVWDKALIKTVFFFTIFGALKHHEMARYELPTYVSHVLGHFWMFVVKITEWIFSQKSLGLWTWTWTHIPIVWDKVPNESVLFDTFPYVLCINLPLEYFCPKNPKSKYQRILRSPWDCGTHQVWVYPEKFDIDFLSQNCFLT